MSEVSIKYMLNLKNQNELQHWIAKMENSILPRIVFIR